MPRYILHNFEIMPSWLSHTKRLMVSFLTGQLAGAPCRHRYISRSTFMFHIQLSWHAKKKITLDTQSVIGAPTSPHDEYGLISVYPPHPFIRSTLLFVSTPIQPREAYHHQYTVSIFQYKFRQRGDAPTQA